MLQDEPRGPHDSRPVHPRGPGESRQRQGSHAPQRPHHPRRPARAGGPSEKLNRGQVAQILTIVRPVLVQPHHPSGPGRKRMHARCASRSLQRSGWAYRRASAQAAPFRLRDRLLLPEEVGLGRQFAIHGISGFSHWAHRFIAGWSQYFFLEDRKWSHREVGPGSGCGVFPPAMLFFLRFPLFSFLCQLPIVP